jgi:hypothetical protein
MKTLFAKDAEGNKHKLVENPDGTVVNYTINGKIANGKSHEDWPDIPELDWSEVNEIEVTGHIVL